MSSPRFVHLHVHSDGSLLDGGNPVDRLVARALEFEMPALAVTDHGVLYSAWDFQRQARSAGLKPIIGMEAYVSPGARGDRDARSPRGKTAYHLVTLAQNRVGYQNLIKLSSIGFREGFYYNPRVDREVLRRHSEGIIVSSACMAGEVAQHLEVDDEEGARRVVEWYADVFKDRYYLEVQAHATEGQARLNQRVFALADEMGIPVIATNDAHFLTHDDHAAHDVLICIGLAKDRSDPDRLHYDENLYFKSTEEMASWFQNRPDALENTVRIAESVDLKFEKVYHVPNFPIDADQRQGLLARVADRDSDEVVQRIRSDDTLDEATRDQRLAEIQLVRELATAGALRRYGDPLSHEVSERLEYELGVIAGAGFSGYHLIVQDFINWAKEHDIVVGPGRGSAAGSLVCYSLGITDIDPLEYDLLFERFLNPSRISMPDVDVDFEPDRRAEVIDYTRTKYGKEAVGQIATFGTMKARAAIRDVGRVLGWSIPDVDRLAKLIPSDPAFSLTIGQSIEKVDAVRQLYNDDPRYRELLDFATRLEGLRRHTSVHAAGVIIAPGPLDDYIPVAVQGGRSGAEGGSIVSQFDMIAAEQAGMLKMDFLGLKTLTVIQHTRAEAQRRNPGLELDMLRLPLNDPATFEMIRAGRTAGIFQFESDLATEKLRTMGPDRFTDLIAANALLRPGPLDSGMTDAFIRRKKGEEPVTYPHESLAETLDSTYGIIVYQEQVMRAAQILAGYSLAEADILRKAVGKKDAELIRKELGRFIDRSVENGIDRAKAEEIAALVETFGRYGFNLSHSAAYTLISFQTAYLKCHHPAEFMAALLTSEIGDMAKVVDYLNEARELGISVLPPDVNESGYNFTVVTQGDSDAIRFGLGAIRNVGSAVIDAIISARQDRPFADFFDFVRRAYCPTLNRRVLQGLVYAGACDSLADTRAQMLHTAEQALHLAQSVTKDLAVGQTSLFGDPEIGYAQADLAPSLPNLPEISEGERLDREKEVLGLYVSGHPLEPYAEAARVIATYPMSRLRTFVDGNMRLVGVVTSAEILTARSTMKKYARLTVSDLTGQISVLVFNEAWERFNFVLDEGRLVVLDGRFRVDDRNPDAPPTFLLSSAQDLHHAMAGGDVAIQLRLATSELQTPATVKRMHALLRQHEGVAPLYVSLTDGPSDAPPRPAKSKVRPSRELLDALRTEFGADRAFFRQPESNSTNRSGPGPRRARAPRGTRT